MPNREEMRKLMDLVEGRESLDEYIYDTGNSREVVKKVVANIYHVEKEGTRYYVLMKDSDGNRLFYSGNDTIGNSGDILQFTANIDRSGRVSNLKDVKNTQATAPTAPPTINDLYGAKKEEGVSAIRQGIDSTKR